MEPANVVVMFVAVPAKSKRSNLGIQTITLPLELDPHLWELDPRTFSPHRVFDRDQSKAVPLCRNFYSGEGLL